MSVERLWLEHLRSVAFLADSLTQGGRVRACGHHCRLLPVRLRLVFNIFRICSTYLFSWYGVCYTRHLLHLALLSATRRRVNWATCGAQMVNNAREGFIFAGRRQRRASGAGVRRLLASAQSLLAGAG